MSISRGLKVLTVLLILSAAALPFLGLYDESEVGAYVSHLLYQHLIGWLVCVYGIGFIAWHTFSKSNQLPYEILSSDRLFKMTVLLLLVWLGYFTLNQPLVFVGENPPRPITQFIVTGIMVAIAGITSLVALGKHTAPRTLLILLITYQFYFTSAVVSLSLLKRQRYLSVDNLVFLFFDSQIFWLVLAGFITILLGLFALKKRLSALEEIFIKVKKVQGLRAASRKQEDNLKQINLAPELADALRMVNELLNSVPPGKRTADPFAGGVGDLMELLRRSGAPPSAKPNAAPPEQAKPEGKPGHG